MPKPKEKNAAAPYIIVMDPAVRRAEVECFNHLVSLSALPLHYHMPGLVGLNSLNRYPENDKALKGIVLLGSAASVVDNPKPWQKPLSKWLMAQMQRDVPTLGLCFGHQLIANLYGAKVGYVFGDKRKHKGLRQVNLKADELWGNEEISGRLVVSHCEMVMDCPKDMIICASSPEVAVDGLRHRSHPIWTFQSHPEAIEPFMENQEITFDPATKPFAFGREIVKKFLAFCH